MVMSKMDLDTATSKQIHEAVHQSMPSVELGTYRKYIANEMLTVLGEMESASKILDFLYLGSEWNSANKEELEQNGITHVLNVTKEIDNFFPELFIYKNVLLYDLESSNLLAHWDSTFQFILSAWESGGIVLVHCKMGISRSSSTVIAFLMKYNNWSLERALTFVRARRPITNPNDGFIQQLKIYEGMLQALRYRENFLVDPPVTTAEYDSDTDLVDFGFEFRVKKLVHEIHEREKANIRRCKSMNSKMRPRCNSLKKKIEEDQLEQFFQATNGNVDYDTSHDSATSLDNCDPLRDTPLSSVTEFSASYIDNSEPELRSYASFDQGYSYIGQFGKSGSDTDLSLDQPTDSFHRLQEAGLVRLRTRQIEARLRRRKRRRKNRDVDQLIMEFEENSSFPCRSTEEFHDESFCQSVSQDGAADRMISAGSEILRIHLRRPSVPNLRKIAINRRRPTSDPSGLSSELSISQSLHHQIYQTV